MIDRANGPCRIVKEDVDLIEGYYLGHVEFTCV